MTKTNFEERSIWFTFASDSHLRGKPEQGFERELGSGTLEELLLVGLLTCLPGFLI